MNEHKSVSLRPVSQEDDRILYEWSNSDLVRSVSLSTSKFSWESPQKWFRKCLKDQKCTIFVGLNVREEPIGQIRLEKDKDDSLIDYAVAKNYRNKGYGFMLIKDCLRNKGKIENFKAVVHKKNIASINIFKRLNFKIEC